jgi:pimeloyl-ACP methyl ester carboxylesterase
VSGGTRGWFRVVASPAEIAVIGEGAGPTVVMLPSRGRGSEDYDDVAEAIAGAGYRVLRPQPRGIGGSTGPMDGLTLHDWAADVAAVIVAEQAGPAVIIGHAFGNFVARMTAADHPTLVRAVVLAAAGAKQFPPELSLLVTGASNMKLPEAERLACLRKVFFAAGSDATSWLTGWDERTSRSQRAAADRTPQSDWWGAGDAKLLDLIAAEDPFRPVASREELRLAYPGRVDVAVIPGTSHAMLPEAPDAVATAIVNWLRSLPHVAANAGQD